MSRGASTFRQRDLTAAVMAAKAAGCEVDRIEVHRAGTIVLITGKVVDKARSANEWDEVK